VEFNRWVGHVFAPTGVPIADSFVPFALFDFFVPLSRCDPLGCARREPDRAVGRRTSGFKVRRGGSRGHERRRPGARRPRGPDLRGVLLPSSTPDRAVLSSSRVATTSASTATPRASTCSNRACTTSRAHRTTGERVRRRVRRGPPDGLTDLDGRYHRLDRRLPNRRRHGPVRRRGRPPGGAPTSPGWPTTVAASSRTSSRRI